MWSSKGCPRCKGDIFIDEDVGGRFVKCLQCGYERALNGTTSEIPKRSVKKT